MSKKFFLIFVTAIMSSAALFTIAYALSPESKKAFFTEEDALLEWLSAILWLSGAIFSLIALIRKKKCFTKASFIIPICGIMAFLDESSFMGLLSNNEKKVPDSDEGPVIIIGGYAIDGIHDAFSLAFKLWRDHAGVPGYIIGSIILGGVIGLAVAKRKSYMPAIMAFLRTNPQLNLFRYAVIMVICAMVLDLDIIGSHWSVFAEELLETLGGLTLAFAGIFMVIQKDNSESAATKD
ncbi:MAG: hypothetical protein ACYTFY_03415 [Planctomycetota bacterium]|jgi:hypothetical protein